MRYACPLAAVVLATSVFSGCATTITSQPLSKLDTPFPRGVIYRLPVTALDIKATYTLVACPTDRTDKPVVRISDASVSAVTIPETDPRFAFLIDPKTLTSWYKTVDDSKIELRDGMLKTVTYEAEDHARDVVGKAVDTLLRFGTISIPGAPRLSARLAERAGIKCNEATRAALKDRDKLKLVVATAKRKLADANASYEADPTPKNRELAAIAKANVSKAEGALRSLIAKNLQFSSAARMVPRQSGQCETDQCRLFNERISPPPEIVEKWFRIHTQGARFEEIRASEKRLRRIACRNRCRCR